MIDGGIVRILPTERIDFDPEELTREELAELDRVTKARAWLPDVQMMREDWPLGTRMAMRYRRRVPCITSLADQG